MDDHSNTERNFALGPRDAFAAKQARALSAVLFAGIVGALSGGLIAKGLVKEWLVEFGFAGFLMGVAVSVILSSRRPVMQSDEFDKGQSLTEEEVRAALDEIEARKR